MQTVTSIRYLGHTGTTGTERGRLGKRTDKYPDGRLIARETFCCKKKKKSISIYAQTRHVFSISLYEIQTWVSSRRANV